MAAEAAGVAQEVGVRFPCGLHVGEDDILGYVLDGFGGLRDGLLLLVIHIWVGVLVELRYQRDFLISFLQAARGSFQGVHPQLLDERQAAIDGPGN
ncbi:MAG: hypothetical protein Q8N61_00050 [bacterium]|nr:hypothetical protein [bacterium]